MISRVADHCFWLGRYVERAESTARLLQVTRALAFDAELPPLHCWRPLMIVSGQHPEFTAHFGADAAGNGDIVQRYMTWATENPVSIRSSVRAAREGARSIREVLGFEIWQATNEMYLWFAGEEAAASYVHDRDEVYRNVRRSTQLCLGLVRSTMLHDEPMDFLWLGVLLERIGQTARTLDMHHHIRGAVDGQQPLLQTALWLSLLRALSGSEAYMKRAAGRISSEGVARFLVSEPAFPRSIAYCVHSAYSRLCDIRPPESRELPGGVALERLRVLDTWVGARQSEPLAGTGVHDVLTHVVDEVHEICETLGRELLGAAAAS